MLRNSFINKQEIREKVKKIKIRDKDSRSAQIRAEIVKIITNKNSQKVFIYQELSDEIAVYDIVKSLPNISFYTPIFTSKWQIISNNSKELFDNVNEAGFDKYDICIVPGRAFTISGCRVGRGGGYYDRYLVDSICYKIGVCFREQIFEELPCEKHDIIMDIVLAT